MSDNLLSRFLRYVQIDTQSDEIEQYISEHARSVGAAGDAETGAN